jgi:hypothetical protein
VDLWVVLRYKHFTPDGVQDINFQYSPLELIQEPPSQPFPIKGEGALMVDLVIPIPQNDFALEYGYRRDRNDTVGELVLRDDGMQMTWIGRVWVPQAVVSLAV